MDSGYTEYDMTEPRKAALSLLITILLFAAFTVASFMGLFDLIEARFYNPGVTVALSGELSHETASIEVFITTIERWFSGSLGEPAVKRSFMVNQTNADIYERSQVFTRLHERLDGLQWVRFIDSGGNRIHYSTWQGDLIREDSATAIYRMYTEAAFYTPLENLLPLPTEDFRLVFDPQGERIVFSLPFYDALDAYRGLAIFSLSISAIQNRLLADRSGGQGKLWLITEPPGLLRGVPEDGMTGILETVADNWKQSGIARKVSVSAVESGGSRTRLVLFSAKTLQGIYIGHLVNENLFVFPLSLKILLLVLFFISMFLVLFLIVNIRQDPMTIVQNRLKNLQVGLIKEYYEQKTDIELARWGMDLMQRREEIRVELRHGLKAKIGKKLDRDINAYIDKSWNDLLAVIGGRLERTVNEEEIHLSLSRLTDTLSVLVERGALARTGEASHPSVNEAERKKAGRETSPDTAETTEEIEATEEMVPFVEEPEEFPVTEELPKPAFEESEEMVPFVADIEALHEETPGPERNENERMAPFTEAVKKAHAQESPEPDEDESEGMVPFVSGVGGTAKQPAESVQDEIEYLDAAESDEMAEPLEDIEAFEDAETAEELSAAEETKPAPGTYTNRFDGIAQLVEWSETADEAEEPLALEIEVSSPFSSPAGSEKGDFIEKNVFDDDNDDAIPLEDIDAPSITPLLYAPFSRTLPQIIASHEGRGLAQKASLINSALKTSGDTDELIIREQGGIAYIQKAALHPTPDEEEDLDPRMKGLVNSVLKQTD
jgi:hypothetical protein